MKTLAGLLGALVVALVLPIGAQEPVKALPPHPLDAAFTKGVNTKGIDEGLLNNLAFQAAVKAALKAKQDQEQVIRQRPTYAGPSPAQAARVAFLRALGAE